MDYNVSKQETWHSVLLYSILSRRKFSICISVSVTCRPRAFNCFVLGFLLIKMNVELHPLYLSSQLENCKPLSRNFTLIYLLHFAFVGLCCPLCTLSLKLCLEILKSFERQFLIPESHSNVVYYECVWLLFWEAKLH